MAAHTHAWLFPIALGVQKTAFHQKTFAINAFYESAPGFRYPCGTIQAAGHMEAWLSRSAPLRGATQVLLQNSFQIFLMTEALASKDAGIALSDGGATLRAWPRPNRKAHAMLRRMASDVFRSAGYFVFAPPQAGGR